MFGWDIETAYRLFRLVCLVGISRQHIGYFSNSIIINITTVVDNSIIINITTVVDNSIVTPHFLRCLFVCRSLVPRT